jgi:hypothetical protein
MTNDRTSERNATHSDILAGVRQHAVAHYDLGAWDYVVECYDDAQILRIVKGARFVRTAIAKMRRHLSPIVEYREDIKGA